MRDLYLAIDVGTGGIRAALVSRNGKIEAFAYKEHDQIVPEFGWSQQRPADWWQGTIEAIQRVINMIPNASKRVVGLCTCGQMHGTVLVDDDGNLLLHEVPLWNDKRNVSQVARYSKILTNELSLALTANIPAPAWPAFKLAWIKENNFREYNLINKVLMPKDWINFKLTGSYAQDFTEASLSFLMDWRTRSWSFELCKLFEIPIKILPEIKAPSDILSGLSKDASNLLGLPEGLPVLVGAGDYPMALLGSGVSQIGMGSDVTGTSSIITMLHDHVILDPQVANVLTPNGLWGAMTLVDAGGDAIRWARRAFHENMLSYDDVTRHAENSSAGANGLFFLPYLSGERIAEKTNSRAQFFGLKAEHTLSDLHRAILEGVAFSVRMKLDQFLSPKARPERIVAASGGAKAKLWLKIKSSMYNVPYILTEEPECGVIGSAILTAVAISDHSNFASASELMIRYSDEIYPDPEWTERYNQMMPIYNRLYEASKAFYDDLDLLSLS